jgi:hypothetical protein
MTNEEFNALKPGDRVFTTDTWPEDWRGKVIIIDHPATVHVLVRRESDGRTSYARAEDIDLFISPKIEPLPLPG